MHQQLQETLQYNEEIFQKYTNLVKKKIIFFFQKIIITLLLLNNLLLLLLLIIKKAEFKQRALKPNGGKRSRNNVLSRKNRGISWIFGCFESLGI